MDIEWDNEAETLISDLSFDDKKDQEQVRGWRRRRGVEGSDRAIRQGKDQEQVRGRRRRRGVEGSNRAIRQGKDQEQVRGRRRRRGVEYRTLGYSSTLQYPPREVIDRTQEYPRTQEFGAEGGESGATGSLCSAHRRYTLADS
jgi:hypothetical protein